MVLWFVFQFTQFIIFENLSVLDLALLRTTVDSDKDRIE